MDKQNNRSLRTFAGARAELLEAIRVTRKTAKEVLTNRVWTAEDSAALHEINAQMDAIEVWIKEVAENMQKSEEMLDKMRQQRDDAMREHAIMTRWLKVPTDRPADD